MFGNEFFDQWLNQNSSEILSKVEREKISNEDMLILSLKAQVNHFHHMDIEFREEFKSIRSGILHLEQSLDRRFDHAEKRHDRLTTILMWATGLIVSTQIGLFCKVLLG